MPNYNPSTIARISDIRNGIWVQTGTLTNTVHLIQNQVELFNIYGRILLHQLFVELLSDYGANATTLQFNYTFTTPTLTIKPLTGASGAFTSMPRGGRISWLGGAVATAAGITVATGLCSDLVMDKSGAIIGGASSVGTIGMLTGAANGTQGTSRAFLFYSQCADDGAYVTAAL